MSSIDFEVEMQEDGWYLATPSEEDKRRYMIGGATEAEDYETLKTKVMDFARGLPEDIPIAVHYREILFNNPGTDKTVSVVANDVHGAYVARTVSDVKLDLTSPTFDELRGLVFDQIRRLGYQNRHVELRLDEILRTTPAYRYS